MGITPKSWSPHILGHHLSWSSHLLGHHNNHINMVLPHGSINSWILDWAWINKFFGLCINNTHWFINLWLGLNPLIHLDLYIVEHQSSKSINYLIIHILIVYVLFSYFNSYRIYIPYFILHTNSYNTSYYTRFHSLVQYPKYHTILLIPYFFTLLNIYKLSPQAKYRIFHN